MKLPGGARTVWDALRCPSAAALLALGAAGMGCVTGAPLRPVQEGWEGPGASAADPILVDHLDDEIRYITAQRCSDGSVQVVGDDYPLYSGRRRCFLDRIEGTCGADTRAYYFLLCE
jgi:hypothetical protein